jgi:hypothetical protein
MMRTASGEKMISEELGACRHPVRGEHDAQGWPRIPAEVSVTALRRGDSYVITTQGYHRKRLAEEQLIQAQKMERSACSPRHRA